MTVKKVKNRQNSLAIEAISLKKPTALDKIIEKVPKPRGAVPKFGLPKWKHMPLESKIPMIPGPAGAYNFTRKKLGKKLWIQTKNAEFNLADPCNYEMEFSYDSLHDEHLARYFSREQNKRRLLKLGFVSKNLDAKCSLRDYNMYRKFLKKLHNDGINRELKRLQSLNDEKRVLEFADSAAKKEIKRLRREERKMLAKNKARKELRQMEKKKMEKRRVVAEKLRQRLESIELAKKEGQRERISKLRAKTEYIRKKRAATVQSQRDQLIETFVVWAKKESSRKKARRERLAREAEDKRNAVDEKWERRKEYEELEIARKKSALRYAEEEREKCIKNYTNKVERERAKAQKIFNKTQRFIRCYVARGALGRGKGTCCRKRQRKMKNEDSTGESITTKPNSTLRTLKVTDKRVIDGKKNGTLFQWLCDGREEKSGNLQKNI